MNYLFELRHNGIKLLLLQKCSISFSYIKPAQRNTSGNNPNTKYHNYSVSSTNFSTYTCFVYPGKSAKNYKTMHGLIPLKKLLWKATKRSAKNTIFRLLLQEVLYKMLLLLLIMQRPFQYYRCYWVKLYPIYRLFFLWADQFLLSPAQMSNISRTLILDRF